jgi:CMP-N-acetylneuraminic acid synthetase
MVSTDSDQIKELSIKAGADVPFLRPPELATDEASTAEVIWHALNYLKETETCEYTYFVILQPTSPLRTSQDIETAYNILLAHQKDSVISVCSKPLKFNHFATITDNTLKINHNFFEEPIYQINGAVYISRSKILLEQHHLFGQKIIPYYMPALRSIDIDTPEDFELAELIWDKLYS